MEPMAEIELATGYVPGAVGRITELHADYYHREWGFGLVFEAKVAAGLSEFLIRFDDARDRLWTVRVKGRVEGSLAVDAIKAEVEGAHLRWFIVAPHLRGLGFGNALIKEAVTFCREKNYRLVYLWTFEGLLAARHLYEKFGFRLVEQREGARWGRVVNEQRFVLILG